MRDQVGRARGVKIASAARDQAGVSRRSFISEMRALPGANRNRPATSEIDICKSPKLMLVASPIAAEPRFANTSSADRLCQALSFG